MYCQFVKQCKMEEGKQYSIYCRKAIGSETEEVLLDMNALYDELKANYLSLAIYKISPDQNILAYSIDTDGSEYYDLYFKDLTTGKLLKNKIDRSDKMARSLEFSNDSKTIMFTVYDSVHRPYIVHRSQIDINAQVDSRSDCVPISVKESEILFTDNDDKYFVSVRKTLSEQFILIESSSNITSEYYYMKSEDFQTGTFKLFGNKQRKDGLEFKVSHQGNFFYIVHNEGEFVNFKIVRTPIDNPDFDSAEDFVPYNEKFYCEDIIPFSNHLALFGRSYGVPKLVIYDVTTNKEPKEVVFPEPSYDMYAISNREYNTNNVRIQYSSFLTPLTTYDYNMDTHSFTVLKQDEVLGGFDKNLYKQEKILARSRDGKTDIPISLVYKKRDGSKDIELNGNNPCLLYGYGSYGSSIDAYFSPFIISLLDRGVVYAIAAIRGGSENGRIWYLDGKLLKKRNTFFDFVDSAEHLINQGYTNPSRLASLGGSAGGLLIGATINEKPELWKACILQVPFVDLMNTMLDPTLPLTTTEYDEWGNPNVKEYYDYMLSYSPVDNIESEENVQKQYPAILVYQSFNDVRVNYWEGAKYVATMRHYYATKKKNNTQNLVLCKTNMTQGHGGSSGRFERYTEMAYRYAFILSQITDEYKL